MIDYLGARSGRQSMVRRTSVLTSINKTGIRHCQGIGTIDPHGCDINDIVSGTKDYLVGHHLTESNVIKAYEDGLYVSVFGLR